MILADSTTERVHTLAVKHGRSDIAEILTMIEIAEHLDIQRISFLPGEPGSQLVPVVVIRKPVIMRKLENQ
jgi:hypothetical protein